MSEVSLLAMEVCRDGRTRSFEDVTRSAQPLAALSGVVPGGYLCAPLVLNGACHGVLEFSSVHPKRDPWTREDLSVLAAIAGVAAAQLRIFGQIDALQSGQAALVNYLTSINGQSERR